VAAGEASRARRNCGLWHVDFPVALYATRAAKGNHKNLYEKSGLRLRERGRKDFSFFSSDLSDAERERQWQEAIRSPRFKSYEDTFMFFNIAALSEWIARLWFAGDLPDDVRNAGFGELLKRNIELLLSGRSVVQRARAQSHRYQR